jgi:DNA polymerase III delta prime subunit
MYQSHDIQNKQNPILRAMMNSMKQNIESKLGYQINKNMMRQIKAGAFPEPVDHSKMDHLSAASTQESVNQHMIEIFENNARFQMKNRTAYNTKQANNQARYTAEQMISQMSNAQAMALENSSNQQMTNGQK